jgi:hypothetical protein
MKKRIENIMKVLQINNTCISERILGCRNIWWENVGRMAENCIPKRVLICGPRGKSNTERPVQVWTDKRRFQWERNTSFSLVP